MKRIKMKVTDENGKTFEIEDLESLKIEPLTDSEGNYSIDSITDANGEKIKIAELKDSNEGNLPSSIFIHLEATHSGKNLNFGIYPEESLAKDHKTYLEDFSKPLLKNHDTNSEPLGRVVETDFGDSVISEGKKAVKLKIQVTDSDAIQKFIDGRYKTFSIGASADTITCDLCKAKILSNGVFNFCGHWKGETYDVAVEGSEATEKKTAYWQYEDMYFSEISVVNNPADRNAQITKIEIDDSTQDSVKTNTKDSKQKMIDLINNSENDDDLLKMITDSISNAEAEKEDADDTTTDEDTSTDDASTKDDNDSTDDTTTDSEEETIESLKDSITELETKVEDLKAENKILKDEIESLKEKLSDKEEENSELTTDKQILEAENEVVLDKLSSFAKKIKNQLENRLLDLKVMTSDVEVTDEKRSKIVKEIKNMSIDEMSTEIEGLKKKIKPKKLSDNTIGKNNGENVETIVDKNKNVTMGDFLEDIIN
ncbi:MAG: hypothetical protein B6I17_04095 [Tenericutes bacterium 4572_104]|nr:MAG: hypothetical protein B6I17_04095 [Tenericutes bacterium 4572_104]